jgi:large subunit ribosomal protein L7/L12
MSEGNGATFSDDITHLGDQIAALTIVKAVQLKDYLKEKYKIEPAVGGGGGGGGAGPAAAVAAPVAAPTEFNVMLEGFDVPKKIQLIKVVRELTSLGLGPAKEFVEGSASGGKAVKENATKEEAEKVKKQLEEQGGKVTIKPAG